MPLRIMNVVGARPNMMKVAPLVALKCGGTRRFSRSSCTPVSITIMRCLRYFSTNCTMPEPDYNLEVGIQQPSRADGRDHQTCLANWYSVTVRIWFWWLAT